LLTDNAIPTILRVISMVRFPSNYDVILHNAVMTLTLACESVHLTS